MLLANHLRKRGVDFREVEGQHEIRVNDPQCGDEKFKLYINPLKRVAYCQRCGTVPWATICTWYSIVLDDDSIKTSTTGLAWGISKYADAYNDYDADTTPVGWLPRGAMTVNQVPRAVNYLIHRRHFTKQDFRNHWPIYVVPERSLSPYRGRILFVVTHKGKQRFWVARDYTENQDPPYLYPRDAPVSSYMYPGDRAPAMDEAWLVEGLFDSGHLWPRGQCIFSLRFSEDQARFLLKRGTKSVVFCHDADVWDTSRPPKVYEQIQHQIKTSIATARQYFKVKLVKLDKGDPTDHPVDKLLMMPYITYGKLA